MTKQNNNILQAVALGRLSFVSIDLAKLRELDIDSPIVGYLYADLQLRKDNAIKLLNSLK